MRLRLYIYVLALTGLFTSAMSSCSDDDMGDSIYDTAYHPLDRSVYTFPLDTFVYENFLRPYNMRFLYKMEDISSDMNKNLIPCSYDKSVEAAVLCKYLWFDIYKELAGEEFLKEYSPRIIHLIGSPSYDPISGDMTLGEAEGGLKITLYKMNTLDVTNISKLNEYVFKTMHHEFAHILNQNYVYPPAFSEISAGRYTPIDWDDTPDSLALTSGFISNYASSQTREDWAEIISNYIVKDVNTWESMLNTATFGWEVVMVDATKFNKIISGGTYRPEDGGPTVVYPGNPDRDSVGYRTYNDEKDVQNAGGQDIQYEIVRKTIIRDAKDNPVLSDGKLTYVDEDGVDGKAVLLEKLEYARKFYKEHFNISLDELRSKVHARQYLTNPDGTIKLDSNNKPYNRLTAPVEGGDGRTLMETLLDEVNKFKALMTN